MDLLEELCDMVQEHQPVRSRPDRARIPCMSTLRYFADEYKAHIQDKLLSGRSVRRTKAEEALHELWLPTSRH